MLACHPPPMPMDGLRLVWQGLHALLLQPMQGDNRSRLVQSSIKNDQARGGPRRFRKITQFCSFKVDQSKNVI